MPDGEERDERHQEHSTAEIGEVGSQRRSDEERGPDQVGKHVPALPGRAVLVERHHGDDERDEHGEGHHRWYGHPEAPVTASQGHDQQPAQQEQEDEVDDRGRRLGAVGEGPDPLEDPLRDPERRHAELLDQRCWFP